MEYSVENIQVDIRVWPFHCERWLCQSATKCSNFILQNAEKQIVPCESTVQ